MSIVIVVIALLSLLSGFTIMICVDPTNPLWVAFCVSLTAVGLAIHNPLVTGTGLFLLLAPFFFIVVLALIAIVAGVIAGTVSGLADRRAEA